MVNTNTRARIKKPRQKWRGKSLIWRGQVCAFALGRSPKEKAKYYDKQFPDLLLQIKYYHLWLTEVFMMDVNKLMFCLALVLLVAWIAGAVP